jgi:hypothetical protein
MSDGGRRSPPPEPTAFDPAPSRQAQPDRRRQDRQPGDPAHREIRSARRPHHAEPGQPPPGQPVRGRAVRRGRVARRPSPQRGRGSHKWWFDRYLIERSGFRWWFETPDAPPGGHVRFAYVSTSAIMGSLYPPGRTPANPARLVQNAASPMPGKPPNGASKASSTSKGGCPPIRATDHGSSPSASAKPAAPCLPPPMSTPPASPASPWHARLRRAAGRVLVQGPPRRGRHRPATRPLDWWPTLTELRVRAWDAYGQRPGEWHRTAENRWRSPAHVRRAQADTDRARAPA